MRIRHHLSKGFNDIPLKNLTYATEHAQRGDVGTHVGWKIIGDYSGETARSQKHRYEVIFTPEEAREFREKLDVMLSRFDQEISVLIDAGDASLDVSDDE